MYTQALMGQMSQTAICYRRHRLEQQLSRWLLHRIDRQSSESLSLTHELIANLLGVRREGITTAAHVLANAGLIRCERGRITVLDRGGLLRRACECYSVVTSEYARLLAMPLACARQATVLAPAYGAQRTKRSATMRQSIIAHSLTVVRRRKSNLKTAFDPATLTGASPATFAAQVPLYAYAVMDGGVATEMCTTTLTTI
jgi:hypothetical protein